MDVICFWLISCAVFGGLEAWGSSDKVKLTDVKALTLYHGQMTTGRRSKPVPQLQCIGGTAGCTKFIPQVVQCYNRGHDGYDVQWECKTDMDNAYRFGRIDVICEGYDYADDPYILKGSCGLEYSIDLTEEGLKRKGQSHDYYGNSHNYKASYHTGVPNKSSWFGDTILIVILVLLIIVIFRKCVGHHQYSPTDGDFNDSPPRYGTGGFFGQQPPPPGFRTDYNQGGCGASTMGASGTGTGGGFWTGAMTGGVLGYMFGNTNRDRYYARPNYNAGSWGSSGFGNTSSSSGGFSNDSTGTRTASGFGGTRRR